MNAAFDLFPWLPLFYYAALAVAAVLVLVVAVVRRQRDFFWRAAGILVVAFLLLHPVVLNEVRKGLPDRIVVVMDESASQDIGGRDAVAERALRYVEEQQKKMPDTELQVIRTAGAPSGQGQKGQATRLFSALREGLADIPLQQVAATILITDGQVHDVPEDLGALQKLAPFHAILTGRPDEFDRKVTIVDAPKYSVLGSEISITVKMEEFGRRSGGAVPLQVLQDGQTMRQDALAAGETRSYTFTVNHPGQNIFEFRAASAEGELTEINNTAPVIVNGIRDRLKVLLVSGAPHMGERAWRNLLKSDPSIDLVHFTILRSLTSADTTPPHELSLIVFPVQELFDRKINDFDLIIFDRYRQYGLLMPEYFSNIAAFVRNGGALFVAMGADKEEDALFGTSVAELLPVQRGQGGAQLLSDPFRPALTDVGRAHPVTADLPVLSGGGKWGEWVTQVPVQTSRGDILMSGAAGHPLLVLDRADKGRVAVLASDNIWLWSKGADRAGPYTEILRNVSHWLMKEPELEQDYIKAEAEGSTIRISQRALGGDERQVEMTAPSGRKEQVTLRQREGSWLRAEVEAAENGIYTFTQEDRKAYVVVGTAANTEFSEVHTSEEKLRPVIEATRGGIIWFLENQDFDFRQISAHARRMGGDGWLGMKMNRAYTTQSVESRDLVPNWLILLIIFGSLVIVWWRESGRARS